MRRPVPALAGGLALLALGGCGGGEGTTTPVACLGGPEDYVAALAGAPGEVVLDGTPLAGCLPAGQPSGQIATVGESMTAAAKELNAAARAEPLGEAPVRLGYLAGVAGARAERTGGIHRDLAINVETAATLIPGDELLPGGFAQRFDEGLAAGREAASK